MKSTLIGPTLSQSPLCNSNLEGNSYHSRLYRFTVQGPCGTRLVVILYYYTSTPNAYATFEYIWVCIIQIKSSHDTKNIGSRDKRKTFLKIKNFAANISLPN